jgi:hypothetical protein
MTVQIIDCKQGTPEWKYARLGIPTASEFATILSKGRKAGEPSKMRAEYMLTLAGERLTGEIVSEGGGTAAMKRGHVMEAEARKAYAFLRNVDPVQVGFLRNGMAGASPDSLIDHNGMLEIKSKLPKLHLAVLLEGKLPEEHKAQVQGGLWIAEREWQDFMSYWPKLRPFIVRVYRDEEYIARLKVEVDEFNEELAEIVEKCR